YDQFNVAAQSVCVDSNGEGLTGIAYISEGDVSLPRACATYEDCPDTTTACTVDSNCTDSTGHASGICNTTTGYCYYGCENTGDTDYRLVYNAGPCDSTEDGDGNGGSCYVGHCSGTGSACATSDNCDSGESCVVGYLQATGSEDCVNEDCSCNPNENADDGTGTTINPDCSGATSSSGVSTEICDPVQFVCVDELTSDASVRDACTEDSTTRTCVPSSTSTVGACFNDRCLADIRDGNGDGYADVLEVDDARVQSCRAYPEIDSPFPEDVVSEWMQYTDFGTDTDGDGSTTDEMDPDGYSPGLISSEPLSDPTTQAAIPYTYVNGFQDSTVCALDEDGVVVDCDCSYDKAEYGEGTGYRYFEIGTGIEGVPEGVCAGGPAPGIPCIDDDDCSTDDGDTTQAGVCTFLSRVDSVYGWNGYCIEKDTSIQTLGSSETEDQACLTWLPVDQLTGATDLYAKYTSAGFSPQDTYYCAEVEMGYTVATSGIACAETQDWACNGGSWEDFRNEADNSEAGQDDCVAGVWCPDGFFAVMTGCGGTLDENDYCTGGGDDDCPYFCVPKFSYKTEDDTDLGAEEGAPCLTPDEALDLDIDAPPFEADQASDFTDDPGPYYININSVSDHWTGGESDIRVYVLQPDQFSDARSFYNDCAAQGVVDNINEYASSSDSIFGDGVENMLSSTDAPSGLFASAEAFRGLDHNFIPEAVCTTVVQVSEKTLEENENTLPFYTYNAAWTDRLWDNSNNTYTLTGSDSTYFGYEYGSLQSPYGIATDYLSLELQDDPAPWALAMCTDDDYAQTVPTVDLTCSTVSSSTGEDARANRSIELSVSSSVYSQYCYDSECTCFDDSDPSDPATDEGACNWDSNIGASFYCDSGTCENDGSISCSFVDVDEDGVDDDCASAGVDGLCSGVCVGGPQETEQCYEDSDCYVNDCLVSGQHITLERDTHCEALDSAPTYTLDDGEVEDTVTLLSQIFGRIYGVVTYSDEGYADVDTTDALPTSEDVFTTLESLEPFSLLDFETTDFETDYADWIWDTRGTAQENPEDHVPLVISVGDCEGTQCYEGVEGKFSVNGLDSENIESEGSERVTVSFYTYADNEQMPIRRIVVDWGDDFTGIGGDLSWPTGSYSGSTAPDNFYKNHRGLDTTSDSEQCTESPIEFGESTNACSSSYVSFTHDYTCTTGRLSQLQSAGDDVFGDRECAFDSDTGRLLNSPCYSGEYCVFQPRVHVMDNWGWCTGTCTAGADDTDGCYTGVTESGTQDECDIENCPSEGNSESCDDFDINSDGIFDTVNPWINYDGAVYILAE
ncbi:hypothetical protein HY733_00750, partial [Candidatus Uhrbacteria bacterium]|nr:hypothetical protein [Candidatus Uhrbacteria bacterium]